MATREVFQFQYQGTPIAGLNPEIIGEAIIAVIYFQECALLEVIERPAPGGRLVMPALVRQIGHKLVQTPGCSEG